MDCDITVCQFEQIKRFPFGYDLFIVSIYLELARFVRVLFLNYLYGGQGRLLLEDCRGSGVSKLVRFDVIHELLAIGKRLSGYEQCYEYQQFLHNGPKK